MSTSFPKDWCQFIIKNNTLLEGGIVEPIQEVVFTAINARLEKRFKALGGWKGKYELVTGETDETAFCPVHWPEDKAGKYRACYKLGEIALINNTYWLSSALGVNDVKLCFIFWVHGGLGGKSLGEVGRKLLSVSTTAAMRDAGVVRDLDDGTIYLPFVFDAAVLAAEYPNVDKTLAPLDAAVDTLLKVHPQFDAAVRELSEKK